MTPFNESQRDKNKNIFAELTTSPNVGRLWLTFELDDLSVLCLGQSFETHLAGQCQTDTTAAQQETNLLTACVLQRETKVRTSHEKHWEIRQGVRRFKSMLSKEIMENIKKQKQENKKARQLWTKYKIKSLPVVTVEPL